MPKVITSPRSTYVPPRFVLCDIAGPIGVFSVTEDLAATLRKFIALYRSADDVDVDFDYYVVQFPEGTISDGYQQHMSPTEFLERYPDA